jgi:hypothetical protein
VPLNRIATRPIRALVRLFHKGNSLTLRGWTAISKNTRIHKMFGIYFELEGSLSPCRSASLLVL